VLACALLKLLPEYEDAVVVRSRDPAVLAACDVVVDVGAVCDPACFRFDHHQSSFTEVMSELGHKTKLSSAGLVYRHFGTRAVARLAALARAQGGGEDVAEPDIDAIFRKVYRSFVEAIDGIDNGVEAYDGGVRNYDVTTTLGDRVSALNPRWNQPTEVEDVNARFAAAVALAGEEFAAAVEVAVNSWWPARALVGAALDSAVELHPSRQILELVRPCPWASHLVQLELEREAAGDVAVRGAAKYVLFPDTRGGGWRVQAVPLAEKSFETRRPLPLAWRGVRDEQLSELLGLEGCIFVHSSGFIGGHRTREGVIEMARRALSPS